MKSFLQSIVLWHHDKVEDPLRTEGAHEVQVLLMDEAVWLRLLSAIEGAANFPAFKHSLQELVLQLGLTLMVKDLVT